MTILKLIFTGALATGSVPPYRVIAAAGLAIGPGHLYRRRLIIRTLGQPANQGTAPHERVASASRSPYNQDISPRTCSRCLFTDIPSGGHDGVVRATY